MPHFMCYPHGHCGAPHLRWSIDTHTHTHPNGPGSGGCTGAARGDGERGSSTRADLRQQHVSCGTSSHLALCRGGVCGCEGLCGPVSCPGDGFGGGGGGARGGGRGHAQTSKAPPRHTAVGSWTWGGACAAGRCDVMDCPPPKGQVWPRPLRSRPPTPSHALFIALSVRPSHVPRGPFHCAAPLRTWGRALRVWALTPGHTPSGDAPGPWACPLVWGGEGGRWAMGRAFGGCPGLEGRRASGPGPCALCWS